MSVFSPLGTFGALRNETSAANRGSSGCYMSSFYAPSSSVVTSFVYRVQDGGNDTDYRLGIYKGGTDEDEISGAKLVWDSGLQSAEDLPTAGTMYWREISLDIELEVGELYWLVFQTGPASPTQSVNSPDHGDLNLGLFFWLAAKGYLNDGFPATAPAKDGNTNLSQSLKAYIKLAVRETEEPVITFRKPWTKQPPAGTEIDWSHPLTEGLAFLFNGADAADPRDLVTGERPVQTTGTAWPFSTVVNYAGKGLQTVDASVNQYAWTGAAYENVAKYLGTQEISSFILGQRNTDTTVDEYYWQFRHNNNNYTYCYELNNEILRCGGNFLGASVFSVFNPWHPTAGGALGQVHSVGSTCISGSQKIYTDGMLRGTDTKASTFNAKTANNELAIGASASDREFGGGLMVVAIWTRELNDAEHAQLSANPWQIFKPETIMVPAGDAAKRRVVVF